MTAVNASTIADALCGFYREHISLIQRGRDLVILLPTPDVYGDSFQVAVERTPKGWLLTDTGFVHAEVASITGLTDPDADVWSRIEGIAKRHGVEFGNGELYGIAPTEDSLGEVLAALTAAMGESLQVGRTQPQPPGVQFEDEVGLFLVDHDIPFATDARVVGSSGVRHHVDFVLRNGRTGVAQAVASEQSMRRSLNIFYDIAETVPEMESIAFVDDAKTGYSNATFQQLSYKARVFLWGQRSTFLDYWFGK